MGNSAPPPASVDLIGSYARRRGADVELVLWEPSVAHDAASSVLVRGSNQVTGSVRFVEDEQGKRLVSLVPRAALGDGQWTVNLVQPDGDTLAVQARLLVQGQRPVVLLWGRKKPKSEEPTSSSRNVTKRVVSTGGRAVDSALKVLPPDTAVTVRSTLRRTARRIVG